MGDRIHQNLMVDVPPWSYPEDQLPVSGLGGCSASDYLLSEAMMAALQRYLPANEAAVPDDSSGLADPPIDAYSCDEFRMYEFKVRRCARGRSHDWTECPYAHPGEKARRRDPKTHHYSGTACPDFRKGNCKRGDSCEFAHGVFECWLHPARYRTQPCKDGTACRRRVCFFAHTPEQLRLLPAPPQQQQQQPSPRTSFESYDGSPMRLHSVDAYFGKGLISSSPNSTLISPPMSPTAADSPPISPARRGSWSPVSDVLVSLRKMQLCKVKSGPLQCSSWDGSGSVLGFRPGFCSLPSTPTRVPAGGLGGGGNAGGFDEGGEPVERVESGRALRAKMYERLSRESGLDRVGVEVGPAPDLGWVSELVK